MQQGNDIWSRWRSWETRRVSLIPHVPWLTLVGLVLGFVSLGGEVLEREAMPFDESVLQIARDLRLAHPWMAEAMRDLSGLGSTLSLTLVTAGVGGYWVLRSSFSTALFVVLSVISASGVMRLLKTVFGRVRPDFDLTQFSASGWSFPSGHTSMSAVVFLILGLLLARAHGSRSERIYIVAVAALLALLVGVSRAALGLHWATDVIAGWAFGTAWSIASVVLAERLGILAPRANLDALAAPREKVRRDHADPGAS